jgi:hypothetical protein
MLDIFYLAKKEKIGLFKGYFSLYNWCISGDLHMQFTHVPLIRLLFNT